MPHALQDENMESVDEDTAVQRYLYGDNLEGFFQDSKGEDEVDFDQSGKHDNAVDYMDFDISDDDLPEEEAPTNGTRNNGDTDGFLDELQNGLGSLQNGVNEHHDHIESSDGLFGDVEEGNDLFGDLMSSPEQERHVSQYAHPQHRPSGLALPSAKNGLALPSFPGTSPQPNAPLKRSLSSNSPPLFHVPEYSAMSPASVTEDDEDGLDPLEIMQRQMLRDAGRGEAAVAPVVTDVELFHQLFPNYEDSERPHFVDLFPPRSAQYKGKAPLKPPKVIQPTKLSLDLLHDQERSFKSLIVTNKAGQESTFNNSFVPAGPGLSFRDDSDEELEPSVFGDDERIGAVTMQDLILICQDWDAPSDDALSDTADQMEDEPDASMLDGDWETEDRLRPVKRRRTHASGADLPLLHHDAHISFADPERAVSRLAKAISLDLNDPYLLVDQHAPRVKRNLKRVPGNKRDAAISRDIAKRYNISNDEAYEQLKQNSHSKVRSTLGSMAIEHSYPATKLQYPFYKIGLDNQTKRAFHRPQLQLQKGPGREYRFTKPKHIKRKNVKGKEAKDVFAKAEDLSFGDNASLLLLEYSEEAPMMMSNFGMGNRLINYYRKKEDNDTERPKREIGETQVLHLQDKSPFSNFGHVDQGETVPTVQNGLFRAPIFSHKSKTTDFILGFSTTYEKGDQLFIRNAENLHVVGQQFPLTEVPGQHSRKVTDAAKKRLRALAFRIYIKSQTPGRRDKVLDNASLMPHLPGHDMPQTRSKMREFMKYERSGKGGDGSTGVWVPTPGFPIPDFETLRTWIRPEDVCLLDSMQVGVQHMTDLGINETKDADEDKDIDEGSSIEQQLAPWRATKNFIGATQGKAMLMLHGEGDPTGRGEGFSFVKTSMKGGFKAVGESVEATINAKKRKDTGGHSYNVADQQKSYDESIRRIWEAQKNGLSNTEVYSDDDLEDNPEHDPEYLAGRANTPRSSFSTPAAFAGRPEDDYMSQFSGHSAGRSGKILTIRRSGGFDANGEPRPDIEEVITDSRVIKKYKQRYYDKKLRNVNIMEVKPSGDAEQDAYARMKLQEELARLSRNSNRREAREKLKARNDVTVVSPSNAASPGQSELDGPASTANGASALENTPVSKGKGRSKDGTARKCANCGQVGHIKTNRKSVSSTFACPFCHKRQKIDKDGFHGLIRGKRFVEGAAPRQANGGEAADVSSFSKDTYSKFIL